LEEPEKREAAFMGKITAAMTHEIKNVLAIIRESSGLMEDLLTMAKDSPFPHKDRFINALNTISAQVERGVELTGRLNNFAHSPDQTIGSLDLRALAEQLIFLSQRFARLRNVVLKMTSSPQALLVIARPVPLQMALFACLECCWNLMPSGGQIHVTPEKKGGEHRILITCEGDLPDGWNIPREISNAREWSSARELIALSGASGRLDEQIQGICLVLPDQVK
jgi:C4-dicarboxylate-specific signal transduction histidine kinase